MTQPSTVRPGDSTERFGYEWKTYSEILPESREQLSRWLGSHGLEAFSGLRVLDVGCGMGRNPYWIAKAGAREVVAVDVDDGSLTAAQRNLAPLGTVARVERRSAYEVSPECLGGAFDRVTCIGVLHHLEDPGAALRRMWSCVRPEAGASLLLWCYAREGNEAWLPGIQAARWLGSRLPIRATHLLARLVAAPLWCLIKIVPWKVAYFAKLRELSYGNFVSIVFDQMLPRIAHYWTHQEMLALLKPLEELGGKAQLEHVQGNSWFARVTRV